MRRIFIIWAVAILAQTLQISAYSQQDPLTGRWEGKVQSTQGELPTTVVFKKEGESYTGRTTGMRSGVEVQLKDVKIEGNKVRARADVETPQGSLTINYTFTLEGETMKGEGALDFGGQNVTFGIELKRVSNDTEGPLTAASSQAPTASGGQQRQRVDVPQPQQKQSIDYFAGQWSFKYIGRESPLWPAPREGVMTCTKRPDGKSVECLVAGKSDAGAYKETSIITFDEATKTMTFTERLAGGAVLNSKADWSSPISIRFSIDPLKVKGQTLQLRRTISVVAGHSFTVAEELSEDGGPFVRLGSAIYTRSGEK
jgi:hypothetical protein